MKQHITAKQLEELSEKGLINYKKYLTGLEYVNELVFVTTGDDKAIDFKNHTIKQLPLLSIGQMVEFLDEETDFRTTIYRRTIDWKLFYGEKSYEYTKEFELCDALWSACKEVLNESK